jgi:5,10-methenyltetrahydrofolate synthetase
LELALTLYSENSELATLSKIELRPRLLTRLREAPIAALGAQVRLLNDNLEHRMKQESGRWAAFKAFEFEADIQVAKVNLSHIDWVYPRVVGGELHFYKVTDTQGWIVQKWGITEPDPKRSERVSDESIDGLLIPALAFDLNCNRLGRGRGFYDRYLGNIKHQPKLLGVALERQLVDFDLPTDVHDVPMHEVQTESRILKRSIPLSTSAVAHSSERKTS